VKELSNDQKEKLLKCATNWNTNSRNCQSAQLVLNILMGELQIGEFKPAGLGRTLEGALPYTERHFKRLTRLLQDLHFVSYTVDCMQPHIKTVR
jgi:U3 small nucleolar RNA-associated protein 13